MKISILDRILLIIFGFEVLDSPIVVVISTIIPLSLSPGMVWQHLPAFRSAYLIFAMIGFLAIVITCTIAMLGKLPPLVLALVHAVQE